MLGKLASVLRRSIGWSAFFVMSMAGSAFAQPEPETIIQYFETTWPEITARMNVSRAAYVRFPLGNPLGEAHRPDQHRLVMEQLFTLLETAEAPTLVELPFRWRRWDRWL